MGLLVLILAGRMSWSGDCRSYSRRIGGHSSSWLSQQLQSEIDAIQRQFISKTEQQNQVTSQNEAAGNGPELEAMLKLRRQISAYQVNGTYCVSWHCFRKLLLQ